MHDILQGILLVITLYSMDGIIIETKSLLRLGVDVSVKFLEDKQ